MVTDDVRRLVATLGLPGMKVLQFAFGETDSEHLPHHYIPNLVVYTATHDNDTSTRDGSRLSIRTRARRAFGDYLGSDGHDVAWDLVRAAFTSVAERAIAPMQDLLGLGPETRMNMPGQAATNWNWRVLPGALAPRAPRASGASPCSRDARSRLTRPPHRRGDPAPWNHRGRRAPQEAAWFERFGKTLGAAGARAGPIRPRTSPTSSFATASRCTCVPSGGTTGQACSRSTTASRPRACISASSRSPTRNAGKADYLVAGGLRQTLRHRRGDGGGDRGGRAVGASRGPAFARGGRVHGGGRIPGPRPRQPSLPAPRLARPRRGRSPSFEAEVLKNNERMLRLFARTGLTSATRDQGSILTILLTSRSVRLSARLIEPPGLPILAARLAARTTSQEHRPVRDPPPARPGRHG